MSTRRLLAVAGAVIGLSLAIVLVAGPLWSGVQGKDAHSQPTGQTSDVGERARADLAARLGVAANRISVVSVEAHSWNDASLGLPETGMMYAQVVTPGQIVTVRYDGRTFVYHIAGQTVKLNERGG